MTENKSRSKKEDMKDVNKEEKKIGVFTALFIIIQFFLLLAFLGIAIYMIYLILCLLSLLL